jgi:hypothetical protein
MATLIRNEFIRGGPGSHSNLMVNSMTGLTVGNTVAIAPKYSAVIEAFLPFNQIKVRLLPLAAPGSYELIFRRGVTVA